MKLRGKIDGNHIQIRDALRKLGYSVLSLANLGGGAPDLLVGGRGINILLEVKNPKQPPSKRGLTDDEIQFMQEWKGQAAIVTDIQSALDAINRALK